MKNKQVFYIHGGSSYRNYEDYIHDLKYKALRSPSNEESAKKWPKNLREDLGENFEVFKPAMPNVENAVYEEWKIWFERHHQYLRDGVILVGWSLGAMFYTRYLIENVVPFKPKALVLLSGAFDYYVSDDSREDGGYFYPDSNNVSVLQDKIEHIHIMHSKDDFVVPYEHALKYQAALPAATLHTFEDKNHFLVEELPELLALIQNLGREELGI